MRKDSTDADQNHTLVKKILRFFILSPFKIGCLIVLLSCIFFSTFGQNKPQLITSLDNQIINTMFRWRGPVKTAGQVLIVDIDEKSLKEIGQWPWPRDIIANLVKEIDSRGALVIGFDIIFAEKDRTSPSNYIDDLEKYIKDTFPRQELEQLRQRDDLNHDLILGNVVSRSPVVLGYVFHLINDGLKSNEEKPFPSISIRIEPENLKPDSLALLSSYRPVLNIDAIAQAETEGFLNVFPDLSGTVRKVPLFMQLDGIPYPSLAFEMFRLGDRAKEITIHASPDIKVGKNSIIGISIKDRFIPTDDRAQIAINFRGPVRSFPYLSAIDVLKGRYQKEFKDKYVIIGTSAEALHDSHAIPFSGMFPGVEVHANIIDNIIKGDPFTYDIFTEIGLTYTIVIIGGFILSAFLAYTGALVGGMCGVLIIISIFLGNYYLFFLQNKLLGITYPLLSILGVFLVVTIFNYFFEYKKKLFIHNAFIRYVSPVVVNQLMKKPDSLSLAGEQRNLTVLFSDIRNFTNISETLDPEKLGKFLNNYLTAMSDIIMEHRGMVDKYIGDAILAIWGAPLDDEEHMIHAVRSSLCMVNKLKSLKSEWAQQGFPEIEIGIGINTGLVRLGNFGSERRFEYTVIGDNVNLASRLENLNKIYGTNILITKFTKDALGDRFLCRLIDKVQVKGKSIPVDIYEPLVDGVAEDSLKEEVQRFEQALMKYQTRYFKEAFKEIEALYAINPLPVYKLYLNRINSYRNIPPSDDWDGTFTFTTK